MPHRACVRSLATLTLGLLAASTLTTTLSACGTSAGGEATSIRVVAAENFWGSIAAQVGGQHVTVTSLIADPSADPHDYEPTTSDAREVVAARYVILNGAGYDPWVEKLLKANPVDGRKTLDVGVLTSKRAGDNPHLWYNPEGVVAAANKMRDDLKALDPAHAADYDHSAQAFLTGGLADYQRTIRAIKQTYGGTPVGATESIVGYLVPALGLKLMTPESYLNAVSEGQDVTAADQITVEQQIKSRQIKVLIYNSQNTPNNIQALVTLAKAHGIPVATVTETMTPSTARFQDWQVSELKGIEAALAQATGHQA